MASTKLYILHTIINDIQLIFEVSDMPYDYYEYLKNQRENEQYTETSELVRQNLWSETVNFKLAQEWLSVEDKILIGLYWRLRYS